MREMRGTKLRSLLKADSRYKFNLNPLRALFETTDIFKSLEEKSQIRQILSIIETELQTEFKIGGHPDYDYLLDKISTPEDFLDDHNRITDVKMCSLFIDLRNFTKRALFIEEPGLETLNEIADIKQKAISTWIKIARFYQGHIHSITGDGIMVLIGGEQEEDKDEWIIGGRALLIALRVLESTDILNEEMKDTLKNKGVEHYSHPDNLLDIKVGIEYSEKTLMNPQGVIVQTDYQNKSVGEVKATSFEVDFAAKVLASYKSATKDIEGSPKYGRVLMMGEKYIELMEFNDSVAYKKIDSYERQMFNQKNCRQIYYLDCCEYKDKIITLDDVAGLCDVYDDSEDAKAASIYIAAKGDKIQHG